MTEPQQSSNTQKTSDTDIRSALRKAINHLEHVLPGQAPIRDFVHHNTLHGFQHLPFPEALKAARSTTGAYGYLPPEKFRTYFQQGRIDRNDLSAALKNDESLASEEIVIEANELKISRGDLIVAGNTIRLHDS